MITVATTASTYFVTGVAKDHDGSPLVTVEWDYDDALPAVSNHLMAAGAAADAVGVGLDLNVEPLVTDPEGLVFLTYPIWKEAGK